MILAWCHPRPGKDMSVPVVSALCPSSRLWAGAGASADSGGHGVGRAGRKVTPKGEDTWGRHLAGCLRSRAAPGSRPDWLAQMCAQHPWAKMEDLQSMGSDGARELRVGVGPRARGNQAQDCACLCGERTRAQPLGCEARGAALPPDCSQGFDSLCLQTHLMPLSCCPAFLPDLPHRLHVMGGSSGSPTPVYRQCGYVNVIHLESSRRHRWRITGAHCAAFPTDLTLTVPCSVLWSHYSILKLGTHP